MNNNIEESKKIIGSIIFSIILPIWTGIISLIISITSLINKEKAHRVTNFWGKSSLKLLEILTKLKVSYENMPNNIGYDIKNKDSIKGAIIVAEHQSTMEILALISVIPRPIFVLKKSLTNVPIFGVALKILGMIPVDRKNYNHNWINLTKEELEKGKNLIIFPEGTRTKFGSQTPYRAGAFKLAQVLGKKIIPVAVNTGLFWPRRTWIKTPGTASIIFGKPMVVENIEDGMKNLRKEYQNLIER